ncbi:MAG: flagellar basal body rod protein FlgC [Planctomycetales bacterium]|nr:flagellar basal body rod protein FlgC [Planctomycetales bacterium]
MNFSGMLGTTQISASGLAAERFRMEVIANNIANANTTQGLNGQPFRRKEVVFAAALADAMERHGLNGSGGVQVVGVQEDTTEAPKVYRPGHPHADAEGFVAMPNVNLSNEMVDLITATRGYEANLKVLNAYKDSIRQSLALLRAG